MLNIICLFLIAGLAKLPEKRRSVLLVLEIEKEFETTRVSPMLAFPHTGDTRNNILWRPY
jgi:hypothetical protein